MNSYGGVPLGVECALPLDIALRMRQRGSKGSWLRRVVRLLATAALSL